MNVHISESGGLYRQELSMGRYGEECFLDRMNQAVRALSLLLPDGEEITCYKDPR